MSRTRLVMACIAAVALVPALAAAQGNGNQGGQGRRAYQEHDRATNTTFTATTDASGNAVLMLKGGDFTLEKVVAQSGETTMRLSQGRDVVTIAISQSGFEVGRGRRSARIDPRTDKQDRADAVRAMLTDSQAVRSFKRLVAALEQRDEGEEDGPLAVSTLVDGAIVQLLDGDLGAPLRIAKRLTRQQRAKLRTAGAKRLPGAFVDCIGNYEASLMYAYYQFYSCWQEAREYSWWSADLVWRLCELEWFIRSEQYIWQFIACFLIPW